MTQLMDSPAAAPGNGQNQLATQRPYEPFAPVGSALSLKSLLETQRAGIALALPRHVTPDRLMKTMLVAANRIPDLLKCTQASVIETINRAAELGLDLSGTLGEAYPVPFNNKIKDGSGREQWVKQCQLIIGYRGLAKLARQSGEIKRIDADIVCVNDDFVFRKGSDAKCEFTPNLKGDRGEIVGAYAYVQFKDGGEQFDFMPVVDIEKIRKRSKSGDKDGHPIGAWKSDWSEMAKKTVFRRVAKWLPLSADKFVSAMEHDSSDVGAEVFEAQTGPDSASRTQRLLGKLTSRPVSENQTFVPADEAINEAIDESTGEVIQTQPEPDVAGADAEPANDAPAVGTWEETRIALAEAAMDAQLPEGDLWARINLWVLGHPKKIKGKETEKTTPGERLALVAAVREGRLLPDGKIAPKQ